jgi:hypothetical protein
MAGTDGLIRLSRQGDGTEDHSHPGQERSPNDVAEPMDAKIQPDEGNDHHASNHQGRRQGLQTTAPSDRDARSDAPEQRADPGHVPGRNESCPVLKSGKCLDFRFGHWAVNDRPDRGVGEHSPADRANHYDSRPQ